MAFFGVTTLRFRLILLVTLSMLPIMGLTGYNAITERNRKISELQEEAVRLADLSAGSVSLVLEGARQMLLSLAFTEPVRTMNGSAASALFADVLKQSKPYLNIGLTQPDGLIIGSGVPLPLERPVYITDRSYFIRLQKTRTFSVSEYLIGKVTNQASVNLGFPLPASPGKLSSGVVYASLNLHTLQDCIAKPNLPHKGVVLVTDRNGVYLARNPHFDKWLGTKARPWEEMEARGKERTGFVEATGIDKIPRIYYFTPVPGSDNGLFVAVGVSKSAILAESRAGLLHEIYWIAFWTAASLAAAWFLSNVSVLNHVHQLTETSRRIAGGDWSDSPQIKGGVRELQQLAQSFETMSAALREHNERLEREVKDRTAALTTLNETLEEEIDGHRKAETALEAKKIEHEQIIEQLQEALGQVKTLAGLLPICSGCKKIRDDKGYWNQIETYIAAHSDAQFSHGLCPDCAKLYFPNLKIETPPPPIEPS